MLNSPYPGNNRWLFRYICFPLIFPSEHTKAINSHCETYPFLRTPTCTNGFQRYKILHKQFLAKYFTAHIPYIGRNSFVPYDAWIVLATTNHLLTRLLVLYTSIARTTPMHTMRLIGSLSYISSIWIIQ